MRISDWSSDVCSSDLMSTPGGHGADWGDTNTTKWVAPPRRHRPGTRDRQAHRQSPPRRARDRKPPQRRRNLLRLPSIDGRATHRPGSAQGFLDRIVARWNRAAVPSGNVNPIYPKRVEQIHRVGGSPPAIPSDPDLL